MWTQSESCITSLRFHLNQSKIVHVGRVDDLKAQRKAQRIALKVMHDPVAQLDGQLGQGQGNGSRFCWARKVL